MSDVPTRQPSWLWTPPAGWPPPPQTDWTPPPGWRPDPSWPPVPAGHQWWQPIGRGSRRRTAIGLVAVSSGTQFLFGLYGIVIRTFQSHGLHVGYAHSVAAFLLLANGVVEPDGVGHSGGRDRGGGPMGSNPVGSCARGGARHRAVHFRPRPVWAHQTAVSPAQDGSSWSQDGRVMVCSHVCTRDCRVRHHREAAQTPRRQRARTAARLGFLSAVHRLA